MARILKLYVEATNITTTMASNAHMPTAHSSDPCLKILESRGRYIDHCEGMKGLVI